MTNEKSLKKRGTCRVCKNRRLVDYSGLCFDCWIRNELRKAIGKW